MKELSDLKNEFYEVMYKYEKSFSEDGVMANLTAWQTAFRSGSTRQMPKRPSTRSFPVIWG